jgi:hypothetical protein
MTEYSEGLYEISKALCLQNPENQMHGFLGGEYGYGQEFKNNVFEMHSFWWGDCTCGFDEKEDEWEESHRHSDECYQTRIQESCFADEFGYKEGHGWNQCGCERELCKEFGLSYPEGSLVHCTCTKETEYKIWRKDNNHSDLCKLFLPNFKHYASGLEISWYKYIGRGMESNIEMGYLEWLNILRECLLSIDSENK